MWYCPNCKKNVEPTRNINWLVFLICLLFGIIPAIIYWALRRDKICPICRCKIEDLERKKIE